VDRESRPNEAPHPCRRICLRGERQGLLKKATRFPVDEIAPRVLRDRSRRTCCCLRAGDAVLEEGDFSCAGIARRLGVSSKCDICPPKEWF